MCCETHRAPEVRIDATSVARALLCWCSCVRKPAEHHGPGGRARCERQRCWQCSSQVALGAMLGVDGAAIAWDANALYITVTSDAFVDGFQPLHVYLEATTDLGTPMRSQGKEYGGLVP